MVKRKYTRRNYINLVNDIINLNIPFHISIVGMVTYDYIYPMLKIEHITKSSKYHVVIQSGIHGNEPESIQVVLNWLKTVNEKVLQDISFTIFPVCNPYGYVHGTRRNGQKQMVNSAHYWTKREQIPELDALAKHYPRRPSLFIDVHGDCGKYGKTEIYAYERIPEGAVSPTQRALRKNNKIIPYVKSDTIYKEPCEYGVIYNPKRDDSIQDYMSDNGCECSVTLEVPGRLKGLNKIYGSVRVLDSIIQTFMKYKKEGKL